MKILILNDMEEKIKSLPMDMKHELLAVFFSRTAVPDSLLSDTIVFLRDKKQIALNDKLEECGYIMSEILATKKILSFVYDKAN